MGVPAWAVEGRWTVVCTAACGGLADQPCASLASACWLRTLFPTIPPSSHLQGRNLVYCAPTSGGKSLVAEVLMLRRILTTNRPAMLVLPFVSICSEKSEHLR